MLSIPENRCSVLAKDLKSALKGEQEQAFHKWPAHIHNLACSQASAPKDIFLFSQDWFSQ